MINIKKLAISGFIAASYFTYAQQNIYIDGRSGNDSNVGNSWDNALKTIDAAFNKITSPTDHYIIHLSQGVFPITRQTTINLTNGGKVELIGGYVYGGNTSATPGQTPTYIYTATEKYDVSIFSISGTGGGLIINGVNIHKLERGGNNHGSLATIESGSNKVISIENSHIYSWTGGSIPASKNDGDKGAIYITDAQDVEVNIKNSTIEKLRETDNRGYGNFLKVLANGTRNVDVTIDNSILRNIKGGGVSNAVFNMILDYSTDQGQSSFTITNSQVYNIRRYAQVGQTAALLHGQQLMSTTVTNNKIQGNHGAYGGVFHLYESGDLVSSGNDYKNNGSNWIG